MSLCCVCEMSKWCEYWVSELETVSQISAFPGPFISAIRPIGYWSLIYMKCIFKQMHVYIYEWVAPFKYFIPSDKKRFLIKKILEFIYVYFLIFPSFFFLDGWGCGWVVDIYNSILISRWYWYALKRPINTSPECIGSVDKRQMSCRNIHTIQITC